MNLASKAIAACVLLIVTCIGVLSYWSEVSNEADRQWVTHTLLVVEKLQAIRIDITQAETGQRGYILTGKDTYLGVYQAGVMQVRRDSKELADLTADNPREREAITRLDPLIAARLAELDAGIEVRKRSGLPAGADIVTQVDRDEKWMGQIAIQIAEMRQNEAGLLNRRLETAAASTRKMKVIIVLGNCFAILMLLAKGFVIHWETRARNLAEQSMKDSNERLVRRTAQLSESNIDLESFAYSVAHDLRAPLRHIAGYSGILAQDYGPCLDAEGMRRLDKITGCARTMGRLVDDLLNLSQIGRQELSFERTALGSVLAQAVEDMAPELAGRDVQWRIEELFHAECDPGLMKQVFTNLLSNAVKYTRGREPAVIEVGQTRQNGERVIFVRDNGVGFEMQYAGKLFGVFQRLHKARDFEGTGVGLAIVQRIIRKHGGRVWAEAAIDRGATFFFTLGRPENQARPQAKPAIQQEEMHVASS